MTSVNILEAGLVFLAVVKLRQNWLWKGLEILKINLCLMVIEMKELDSP